MQKPYMLARPEHEKEGQWLSLAVTTRGYCKCIQAYQHHLNAPEKYLLATKRGGRSQACFSAALSGGTKHLPGEGTEPPGILMHLRA